MNTHDAFWPTFHQVALYVPDHDAGLNMLRALGYNNWSHDRATLVGFLEDGTNIVTEGRMSFNYDVLGGRELELLTYYGDSHHHRSGRVAQDGSGAPFISHMSAHVEDAHRRGHEMADALRVPVVHEFETFNHHNPAIAGTKRFRELILGTRDTLGFDIKLIERLYHGPFEYHG